MNNHQEYFTSGAFVCVCLIMARIIHVHVHCKDVLTKPFVNWFYRHLCIILFETWNLNNKHVFNTSIRFHANQISFKYNPCK